MSSPLRCFRCQSWGHHKTSCRAPAPRCGVCSASHWTETCLARLRKGEHPPACCPSCSRKHHVWNPRCPARPRPATRPAAPSLEGGLQSVLVEFGALLAGHFGISVTKDQLNALVQRACQRPPAEATATASATPAAPAEVQPAPRPPRATPKKKIQLTPRPLLLKQKAQEAPCGAPSPAAVCPPRPAPGASPLSGGSPPDKRRKLNSSATQTVQQESTTVGTETDSFLKAMADASTSTSVSTSDVSTSTFRKTSEASTATEQDLLDMAHHLWEDDRTAAYYSLVNRKFKPPPPRHNQSAANYFKENGIFDRKFMEYVCNIQDMRRERDGTPSDLYKFHKKLAEQQYF